MFLSFRNYPSIFEVGKSLLIKVLTKIMKLFQFHAINWCSH